MHHLDLILPFCLSPRLIDIVFKLGASIIPEDEFPKIKEGLIQRKKYINFQPAGVSGIALNTLEEPFSDIWV